MKIYAGVTLYHPSTESLAYVMNMADIFDLVVVYDNSGEKMNYVCKFSKENICYVNPMQNNGLSIAFQYMLDKAEKEGCDFLFLTDQDSHFDTIVVNSFLSDVKNKKKGKRLISGCI